MGYTHYWEITGPRIQRETWNLMCNAAEQVFRMLHDDPDTDIKLVYGASRTSPPVTNQSSIRFNGHPDKSGAYEDCIINRTGSGACKTGSDYTSRQPYDLAVVAVLQACSLLCSQFVWRSDGDADALQTGMSLGDLAVTLAKQQESQGNVQDKEQEQEVQTEQTMPAQPAANGAVNDQVQQALQILMQAMGSGQAVDAEQVRSIVTEEMEKHGRAPTRVEIVKDAGEPREVTGASHHVLPDVLKFLSQDINVMLVGPAGSGKTTLAIQAAEALERPFYLTGAILQKYELLGFVDANGVYRRSSFRDAYEHGGIFLWDEIDSSNPAALVAFHAALENGHADFPDCKVERHPEFICIGAANTYGHGATREYVGRNALDGATLDRYAVVSMDYDESLEESLAGNPKWCTEVQAYRRACSKLGIKHIISPRASIRGARMLAAGMERTRVLDTLVFKGLASDQVTKIQQEAGFKTERF